VTTDEAMLTPAAAQVKVHAGAAMPKLKVDRV